MGVSDRPLTIPMKQPAPGRTFNSFLRNVLSTFLAFVLAWRVLIFRRVEPPIREEEEDYDVEMAQPGPSSVLSLLSTDSIPDSSSSGDDRPPPPPPALLGVSSPLPAYLDTICEEESDDLRSISSSSFASPRTVIDRSSAEPIDNSSFYSDSDYRSPEARSPVQLDKSVAATSDAEESADEVTIIEGDADRERRARDSVETREQTEKPSTSTVKREKAEVGERTEKQTFSPGLLKELARLGQDTQLRSMADSSSSSSSSTSSTTSASSSARSIISQVAREMSEQAAKEIEIPANQERDADREQDEELVYNEERRKTVTMDDNISLNSVSINLDATKDSLLNQSITSNPSDEASAMETTVLHRPNHRPPSPPNDLPPPPPQLQSPKLYSPPISQAHISPIRPAPPPPSVLNTAPIISRTRELAQLPFSAPIVPPPPPPPPPPQSIPNFMEIQHRIQYSPTDRADQGMSSPPMEPPPPPPMVSGHKSGYSSREDLLSDTAANPSSRSTVREIPVHRAPSAAPSTQSTVLEYRMPSSYVPPREDTQDEYYRREVISRTIITRSTEALSQPPLRSSSPIERDRYISYPDPNTREERTVDYKVTYHRNVEEEERRIREDQERRRQEEEERRKREAESRRQWEIKERDVLERLRRDREQKEIEAERNIIERERAEKDRIERDRINRERAEMARRDDWERMEQERRGLEEADLARKRQLEKDRIEKERIEIERIERERLERERERLERERLEEERREQERQEKIRIERERIERERIEIERIERIKRERIEREQKEREKEKEEEERLKREREELERIERERRELEIKERELKEIARREAEERERQRLEDEAKEQRRREEERREAELLADIKRQADERERLRKMQEREEQERLERIRREQQRVEMERAEAERRERDRAEEERRELELIEAQRRNKELREQERLDDQERERARVEEERREKERREIERKAAQERERNRRAEEEAERLRLMDIERAAATRRAQRMAEHERDRDREELDRKAREIAEMERRENDRRERERLEEERSLAELKEKERKNQEIRERERRAAAEREAARREDDRRSRDKLDFLVKERTEHERFEMEKRRLLAEKEAMNKKKYGITSGETMQKLIRAPYFSRENLSNEYTTKVERQVIERVDRNVWVDDYRLPSSQQSALQYSLDSTTDDPRDRLYNPNELGRNGSTRTSRYRDRARMEKARREFITGAPESADPLSDRFNRSSDELSVRGRPDYRGPLLQKFHDAEFKSKGDQESMPYSRVGPSQYGKEFERLLEETERKYAQYRMRMSQPNLYSRSRQYSTSYLETDIDTGRPDIGQTTREVEETNMDEVHRRSGSVVDYNRMSRREATEAGPVGGDSHTRSRSADYLMDRRLREETEPPENELQKAAGDHSPRNNNRVSEHEMRFRKSTEKLTVPDWYRDNRPTGRPTDVDSTLPRTVYRTESPSRSFANQYGQQPFSYTQAPPISQQQPISSYQQHATTPLSVGVELPKGMFDRYKSDVDEVRRSRTSLHQIGQPEQQQPRQEHQLQPQPMPRRSISQEVISSVHFESAVSPRALPGYTVSEIPGTWNMQRNRSSRVVEVADTFHGPKKSIDQYGNVSVRYGGRVTIEEVLDSIFQQTSPTPPMQMDTSLPMADNVYQGHVDGPGIYTPNYSLMDRVMKQPELAEQLLKSESLFVRCSYCHRTKELAQAKLQFVSCKHCYTYYCSRDCRLNDWSTHNGRCSFARINTLCKDVIMKVREDTLAQGCMSRIARDGFASSGRGSVNIRLASPQMAQAYVSHGWSSLSSVPPAQLLYYYTIAALIQEKKEPSLIALCEKYDPNQKFILSVSIIADIEHCPQTPPPETVDWPRPQNRAPHAPQQPQYQLPPVPQQQQQNQQQYQQQQHYNPYSPITLVPTDV